MNTDVMFSSKTDMWATPQYFFDELNNEFGFEIDVCATDENAKCGTYYTKEQDGLSMPWSGTCWCNPPYGREIGKWVAKAYAASQEGGLRSLCFFPQEQIPNGFMTIYTGKQRFALLEDDLNLVTAKTPPRFLVW